MKHHPDRNPDDKGSEEKFKEAKEGVRDPVRREEARGLRSVRPRGRRSFGGLRRCGRTRRPRGLRRIRRCVRRHLRRDLRQAGGGRGRGNGVYRGADLRYNLELTLEEAARGTEAKIRIPAMEECATCHGSGAKPGTQPKTCPDLQRPGAGARVAGLLLDPADLSAVPRHRQDHSRAVRDLRRRRPRQEAQDAVGEDSRRRRPGRSHSPLRRRRGGPERRSARRSVRRREPQAASGVPARRTAICIARCRSALRPRRLAARSRFRRSTATPRSRSRPRRRPARSSACAARASRACAAVRHGDLFCHVAIETPVKLTSRQKELLREFEAINAQRSRRAQSARQELVRSRTRVLRTVIGSRTRLFANARSATPHRDRACVAG